MRTLTLSFVQHLHNQAATFDSSTSYLKPSAATVTICSYCHHLPFSVDMPIPTHTCYSSTHPFVFERVRDGDDVVVAAQQLKDGHLPP